MAKSKKKSSSSESNVMPWVIRGVLVVVLGIVVVIGLKELRVRQAAQASLAAVSQHLADSTDEKPLLKSQVQPLLVGSPKLESADPKALNSPTVATAERFSWPGLLRTYTMTIGYSLGQDPEVEVVEGPK